MGWRSPRKRADLARIVLLAAIGLGFTLSAVDTRSGAHTPWHDHIVLGAHGLSEWAHELASHHHSVDRLQLLTFEDAPLLPAARISPSGHPRVLSIGRNIERASVSIFDFDSQVLNDMDSLATLPTPASGAYILPLVVRRLTPVPVPIPDPPPRSPSTGS